MKLLVCETEVKLNLLIRSNLIILQNSGMGLSLLVYRVKTRASRVPHRLY